MASILNKVRCYQCPESYDLHTCGGCGKTMCKRHFAEHREELHSQMNEITTENDAFVRSLAEVSIESHPLMDQLTKWAEDAKRKIDETAAAIRSELGPHLQQVLESVKKTSQDTAEEVLLYNERGTFDERIIDELKDKIEKNKKHLGQPPHLSFVHLEQNMSQCIALLQLKHDATLEPHVPRTIPENLKWRSNGCTIPRTSEQKTDSRRSTTPLSIDIDRHGTLYIADTSSHAILTCTVGSNGYDVFAGGTGAGKQVSQLNNPMVIRIDRMHNSLIIGDWGNGRVVRLPLAEGAVGEILMENIQMGGLALDHRGNIYVSDTQKHVVRRFQPRGGGHTIIVGEEGKSGQGLNQLNGPSFLFVGEDRALYISDTNNHRVLKLAKGATECVVVAGGHGSGNGLSQLKQPRGVLADVKGSVYVVDQMNNRIMRWDDGATEGVVVIGHELCTLEESRLKFPYDMCLDSQFNLYVADMGNHRIQMFEVDRSNH